MKANSKMEKILEEGKKCKEKFGNIGSTGPRGKEGTSETITIRNAYITDGDATVINTLLDKNHILDFYIPKGEKGEIG